MWTAVPMDVEPGSHVQWQAPNPLSYIPGTKSYILIPTALRCSLSSDAEQVSVKGKRSDFPTLLTP